VSRPNGASRTTGSGVAQILNDQLDITVVAEEADGEAAVALYRRERPDVMLVDLRMPGLDGAQVVERIRREFSDAVPVVLTTYETDDDIDRALLAGAKGYLLKDVTPADLIACVRTGHQGGTWVLPVVASRLVARMTRVHLTPREMGMLRLVAAGKANREIGEALNISEATVKIHLSHLFEKLGATSRTEAVAKAAGRGLIRFRARRGEPGLRPPLGQHAPARDLRARPGPRRLGRVDSMRRHFTSTIEFGVAGGAVLLPTPVESALRGMAREELTNAVRHRRASWIRIELEFLARGAVRLAVTDQGVGFDTTRGGPTRTACSACRSGRPGPALRSLSSPSPGAAARWSRAGVRRSNGRPKRRSQRRTVTPTSARRPMTDPP
jgi:two-component system NarL family response regulator